MKKKINAEIIADSVNEHGNRITTFVLTYPRIVHAEFLTHRLFSRNAASSRAIPVVKMMKDIETNPFYPVAWQKNHSGMQGTEYFESADDIQDCKDAWKYGMKEALATARMLKSHDATKQIINRVLEPYQWYTCIVTATEYDNFFELRCPQYTFESGYVDDYVYKSRKDFLNFVPLPDNADNYKGWTDLDWLKRNKGAGEIHISLLAEAMWDARNESEPKQLKAGEWHIPFGDKMDMNRLYPEPQGQSQEEADAYVMDKMIKIATARCARVSYLNFESKDDYEADVKLYDRLLAMRHMSPFEHCARAMSEEEYETKVMGDVFIRSNHNGVELNFSDNSLGWSGNFRGFVQLRKEIE